MSKKNARIFASISLDLRRHTFRSVLSKWFTKFHHLDYSSMIQLFSAMCLCALNLPFQRIGYLKIKWHYSNKPM